MVDDAGCLRIVGRSKDMFIVGGFNAYPAEIENALLRHPDIQQVAVIGVPDERLGEVGMAFVVARPGSSPTGRRDHRRGAASRWPTTRCPAAVELVDELPLNATGKVEKLALAPAPASPDPDDPNRSEIGALRSHALLGAPISVC